ncbi:hypothetical protein ECG_02395 [Echinococcus granulosus]|uniref:Uncharacterized protein n=1 Tax=Echinococcus granulosus TaxID=6210 RepID=A0A068WZS3_ECHGR|nr:hypothetical protein ECG_02395 [Echinococcus granulosus]CDS23173.1 hypothetical protein EgrG_001093600 [Echinococcus granulosus]
MQITAHVKAVSTRHLLFSSAESAFQWQDEEGGTNRDPVKCQPIDRSPGLPCSWLGCSGNSVHRSRRSMGHRRFVMGR